MIGGSMVVALGRATADESTLLGHIGRAVVAGPYGLEVTPGRLHAPGETAQATLVRVPQVRQTAAVLGTRAAGMWGYLHGVNEHGVAMGCTPLRTRLRQEEPGLLGPDLVRLTLERSASAIQAADVLTSLVRRHGLGAGQEIPAEGGHHASFLVADAREALLLEAGGQYWAVQEIHEVRAVCEAPTIRQDWDALAPGLATHVIEQGWWPEDGSKVDFAGALADAGPGDVGRALRSWGRATLRLEEMNGRADVLAVRRLLSELAAEDAQASASLGQALVGQPADQPASGVRLVVQLPAGSPPLAWWGLEPSAAGVYLPVPVVGELPEVFRRAVGDEGDESLAGRTARLLAAAADRPRRARLRAALEGLQAMYDSEAAEFALEAAGLRRQGDDAGLRRLAGSFAQHVWEEFAEVADGFLRASPREPEKELSSSVWIA